MARVHPLVPSPSTSYITSRRETFTIWLKSLVMQANGCTVYNQNGDIVYRIDNYESKRSREVYLMNLQGKVLFTLQKSNFLRRWECYRGEESGERPVFQVTRNGYVNVEERDWYTLVSGGRSVNLKIVDGKGRVVAEAKRKLSSSGQVLGDDVLNLVVEENVDHSLVVALVAVYALTQRLL